jgi:hypothetical protein
LKIAYPVGIGNIELIVDNIYIGGRKGYGHGISGNVGCQDKTRAGGHGAYRGSTGVGESARQISGCILTNVQRIGAHQRNESYYGG